MTSINVLNTKNQFMRNQLHPYTHDIAARVGARRAPDVGALAGQVVQTQQAILSNQLTTDSSRCHGGFQNGGDQPSNTLLEREHASSSEQVRHKRVVLFFRAKPDGKSVKIDLLLYMQLGLAKESRSLSPSSKAGKSSIRQIGERFHNFPVLSLGDAWLRWHRLELSPDA